MRRARRHDHDVPGAGIDLVVGDEEARLALVHHEDLLVLVTVERRPTSRRRVDHEERDPGSALETLPAAHRATPHATPAATRPRIAPPAASVPASAPVGFAIMSATVR